jgi:hypothetical protein
MKEREPVRIAQTPHRVVAHVPGAVAGTLPGWRQKRRGSFLVIVVGTLALLSVLAILYVTVGRQDLRAKAALEKRTDLDDVPRQIANYIANDIIARDALARWTPAGEPPVNEPRGSVPTPWREATDYPGMRWEVRSDSLDVMRFFDPVGSMDPPQLYWLQLTGNYTGPILPSDPWLAPLEPTWLNYSGAPPPGGVNNEYLMRRDWAIITNIAPDGRFVNLANLRDNFDALPGVGNDANGRPRLSTNLTVFDDQGRPMASPMTDFGLSLAPQDFKNRPAYWTMRQRGAFRPVSMPTDPPPSSPLWPRYQWADADGDGMFDSRWFQLTDWRAQPGSGAGADIIDLLQTDGSIRYFIAARIVDLSGLINVNTAGDLRAAPDIGNPVGSTPAEIDLRRALTLLDVVDTTGSAYQGLFQKAGVEDYRTYDPRIAYHVGRHGYTALRLALEGRYVPPLMSFDGLNRYTSGVLAPGALEDPAGYVTDFNIQPSTFLTDYATTPVWRRLVFTRQVNAINGTYVVLGNPGGGQPPNTVSLASGFGVRDTAELLNFRATNDPRIISDLERTLGGRLYDTNFPGTFSPLRDNRGADVEGARGFQNPAFTQSTLLHFAADLRQRLTATSGARDLVTTRGASPDQIAAGELKVDLRNGLPAGAVLFAHVAAGLAPYSEPTWWTDPPATTSTLFYGYQGPELATLISAHLTANAVDAFDSNSEPTAWTVALSESFPSSRGGGSIQEADAALPPQQQLYSPAHNGRLLDLGSQRLAGTGATVVAPAINVFGIEPQPFITQVTTLAAYVDAPGSTPGAVDENPGDRITINGTIDESNPDFLFRIVAFQLTNPFNEAVSLGSSLIPNLQNFNAYNPSLPELDRIGDWNYIEWGGRYYLLVEADRPTFVDSATEISNQANNIPSLGNDSAVGRFVESPEVITLRPIIIPPGKTVTVYALSQDPVRIQKRLAAIDPQYADDTGSAILRVVENNLRNATDADVVRAAWIPEFNPATGRLFAGPADLDFVRDPVPASTAVHVNLYRMVRTGSNPGQEAHRDTQAVPPQYWDNQTGPQTTTADYYTARNVLSNDRLIDRFRPSGSLDRTLPPAQNQIAGTTAGDPEWEDEAAIVLWANARRRADPGAPNIPLGAFPAYCIEPKHRTSWNVSTNDGRNTAAIQDTDFTGYDGGHQDFNQWVALMRSTPLTGLPAYQAPNHFTTGQIPPPGADVADPRVTDLIARRYAQIVLPNGNTTGPNATMGLIRPADILQFLAIGPSEKPLNASGNVETDPLLRWTTLAEAMASALGHENYAVYASNPTIAANDVMRLFAPVTNPQSAAFESVLDRGCLYLDRYTPFEDMNTNGAFDPGTDRRRYLEIPPALAVLDRFTTVSPGYQAVNAPRVGIININTALLTVLRTLPMLSPPPNTDPEGQPWWWWTTPEGMNESSDIAATLAAYRDKGDGWIRTRSHGAGPAFLDRVSFAEVDRNGQPIQPDTNVTPYDQLFGRGYWTEIDPINEWPGFRSVGEILAARFIDNQNTDPERLRHNMDFLGYDSRGTGEPGNNSRAGVASSLLNDNNTVRPDRLPNEHKEKLFIYNAVAGNITTRSDVFACWFIVHGYKRSDVENVKPNDPIVPSVKRRFLMIVDRSRVTRRGDKADILHFQELPLTPND